MMQTLTVSSNKDYKLVMLMWYTHLFLAITVNERNHIEGWKGWGVFGKIYAYLEKIYTCFCIRSKIYISGLTLQKGGFRTPNPWIDLMI